MISGSSGSADGFQVVRPRSPGVIDMFPALIYASVRWRDGIIDAITRLQPAQQKTKYLWRTLEREIFQDFGLALDLTYRKYDRFATLPGFYTGLTDMKAWYYPDTKHWISQSDYMEAGKIPATLVDSNGKVISTGAAAGKSWYVFKEGVEYTDYNYESNYSNDRYNDFYGIDLVANKRLSHRWMMNGSISLGWQKAYYGKSGYVDPNNIWAQEGEPYAVYLGGGSGKLSIPAYTVWMAKLQGLYQLPLDFDVSFTSTARQGWVKPEGLTLANYDLPNSNKQDAWVQIKKMSDYDRLPII